MAALYEVNDGDTAFGADVNQYKDALEGASSQQYALKQLVGADFSIQMATSNGSDKVSFLDSSQVEVASIDSDGNAEYAGDTTISGDVTVSGNLAVTGTASITGALTLDGVDIKNSYTNILARSTVATTTASVTAVDLVTLSTDVRGDALSIATDRWARVSFNYRKLATTANAVAFGLKINSTVVIEAANSTGVPRSSATQQAESGFGYFLIPPRSTNYGFGVDIDYSTFTTAGAVTVSGKAEANPNATSAVPNAVITSLAIRAINATASNSAEVTVVAVETW